MSTLIVFFDFEQVEIFTVRGPEFKGCRVFRNNENPIDRWSRTAIWRPYLVESGHRSSLFYFIHVLWKFLFIPNNYMQLCRFFLKAVDQKVEFNTIWNQEFKSSKFSGLDSVFDFFYDDKAKEILPWSSAVSPFVLDPLLPLQAQMVQTAETVRIRYLLGLLVRVRKPVMLVGPAGSGKSVLMSDFLKRLPTDDYAVTQISFNYYTTSMMLQNMMEKPLEKKSGRSYGPVGSKRMIYFLDDMNMPEVRRPIEKMHVSFTCFPCRIGCFFSFHKPSQARSFLTKICKTWKLDDDFHRKAIKNWCFSQLFKIQQR